MQNLTLDLETLAVESFDMTAEEGGIELPGPDDTDRFPMCTGCC
jgi:hypothetical protein